MSSEDPQTDREWLMRIDGKIDGLLVCQKDHEERIRGIETKQNQWIGKETVVAAITSFAVAAVTLWIGLKQIFGGS
jgi:hypothetical protein